MNKKGLITIIIVSLFIAIFIYVSLKDSTQQTLISFPEDTHVSFLTTQTSLSVEKGNQNQAFKLIVHTDSKTDKPVYLRQDVSLVYEDGRLIDIMNKWENNTDYLSQMSTIHAVDSGHFEAITIHHAETHYPDGMIRGKEKMTYDHLNVMASPLSHLTFFKIPVTPVEKEWYDVLYHTTKQQQHYILEQAYYKYHINPKSYYIFPLSYLHVYNENSLPNLSLQKTHQVISQLWEGLYKNYIMGIKTADGKVISPLGSSIPYILYSKDGSHLYIVTQTINKDIILLKQNI